MRFVDSRVLCLVLSLSLFACSSSINDVSHNSGFLGGARDYNSLSYDKRTGVRKYVSSPKALSKYSAFSVAPIRVLASTGSDFAVTDREVQTLAEEFRSELIRSLDNKYSQLNSPAKDKAIIKIALTGVESNSALRNLRPGILVEKQKLGGAKMEAEIVDSVTNKRVAAFVDTNRGDNQKYFQGLRKWGGAEQAFKAWADSVRRFIQVEG